MSILLSALQPAAAVRGRVHRHVVYLILMRLWAGFAPDAVNDETEFRAEAASATAAHHWRHGTEADVSIAHMLTLLLLLHTLDVTWIINLSSLHSQLLIRTFDRQLMTQVHYAELTC